MQRHTRESTESAQILFQQAVDLDPRFTLGLMCLAITHQMQGEFGWTDDPKLSYSRAEALGRKSIALDLTLAYAHPVTASTLLSQRKSAEALEVADTALSLSPADPDMSVSRACVLTFLGRPAEALALVDGTLRRILRQRICTSR